MHLLSRDHVDTDELLNDIVNFERLDISRTQGRLGPPGYREIPGGLPALPYWDFSLA
jgi:hypothetical protein